MSLGLQCVYNHCFLVFFSTFFQADKNIKPMLHVTGPLVVDSMGASAIPLITGIFPYFQTDSSNTWNRLHHWALHAKLLSGKCQKHPWWQFYIGAGNGLVPSGIIRDNVYPDLCPLMAPYWRKIYGDSSLHPCHHPILQIMMTSSNGNIFLVAGLLSREFTGHRWNPLT